VTIMLRLVPPLARMTITPEMTPVVPPYCPLPAVCEVAPMYFSADDALNFNDHPKTWNLPDCAVTLWTRAGEWSARNREHGFVPADMLARFCGDPVQAVAELLGRGLWQRVKGGYLFSDWEQVGETAEQQAEREAADEGRRAGKSAGGALGNHKRWHSGRGRIAPGCEFCEADGPAQALPKKRTSHKRSHTDRISDSDATPIDRSDLDQSSPGRGNSNQKRPAARTGSDTDPAPRSQAFRVEVIAKVAAVLKTDIGPGVADAIAADVLGGKTGIDHKLLYVLTAIDNEKDPFGRWPLGQAKATPPPAPSRPEHCGKCDPVDRRVYDPVADTVADCPDCHPRSRPAWEPPDTKAIAS
jgi:hypothetical protein